MFSLSVSLCHLKPFHTALFTQYCAQAIHPDEDDDNDDDGNIETHLLDIANACVAQPLNAIQKVSYRKCHTTLSCDILALSGATLERDPIRYGEKVQLSGKILSLFSTFALWICEIRGFGPGLDTRHSNRISNMRKRRGVRVGLPCTYSRSFPIPVCWGFFLYILITTKPLSLQTHFAMRHHQALFEGRTSYISLIYLRHYPKVRTHRIVRKIIIQRQRDRDSEAAYFRCIIFPPFPPTSQPSNQSGFFFAFVGCSPSRVDFPYSIVYYIFAFV